MDRETILEELKKILLPYTREKDKINSLTEDTKLLDDLPINSANIVDIIIDTETMYNIEIDMDSAAKISTVGSCMDIITEKQKVAK
ncbi:MAG: acyl carrier protein [Chitinophagaceae bacterium]|jgi:acyl carrier protein|nr:MAG: acyl carrier protein [Chitinophagaceae bacterium]